MTGKTQEYFGRVTTGGTKVPWIAVLIPSPILSKTGVPFKDTAFRVVPGINAVTTELDLGTDQHDIQKV